MSGNWKQKDVVRNNIKLWVKKLSVARTIISNKVATWNVLEV